MPFSLWQSRATMHDSVQARLLFKRVIESTASSSGEYDLLVYGSCLLMESRHRVFVCQQPYTKHPCLFFSHSYYINYYNSAVYSGVSAISDISSYRSIIHFPTNSSNSINTCKPNIQQWFFFSFRWCYCWYCGWCFSRCDYHMLPLI